MVEFKEIFREINYLWDSSVAFYATLEHDCAKSSQNNFCKKFQQYDSSANVVNVRKKIDSFRTAYLREIKKVEVSKITDSGLSEIYIYTSTVVLYHVLKLMGLR